MCLLGFKSSYLSTSKCRPNNQNTNKTVTTNLGGNLQITVEPDLTPVTNDNLDEALSDCSNATTGSGGTYNCTYNLNQGYVFPDTNQFRSTTSASGGNNETPATGLTPTTCESVTSNSTSLTCNNIPAPENNTANTLQRNNLLRLGTGNEPYTDKGNVNITTGLITITNNNLGQALQNCSNKTVESNATYNCTYNLNQGYKFPATGNFKAATSTTDNGTTPGTLSPNCSYTPNATTGNLTCNNIPSTQNDTPEDLNREILLRLGNTGNYTDKGNVSINSSLTPVTEQNFQDALNNCNPQPNTVAVNGTYTCRFTLKNGYIFTTGSNFTAGTAKQGNNNQTLSPGTNTNCTTPTPGQTTLTCNNIKTQGITNNTQNPITRNILLKLNNSSYKNKGNINITAGITDIIFIPSSNIIENPNQEQGLKVFGDGDYTLTVRDPRLTQDNKTAVCDFRMKEATAVDNATDETNLALGYNTITTNSLKPFNNQGSLTQQNNNTYFRVNYNQNNGASFTFPANQQLRTDYNIQIRCTRSDNQQFARDQKVNFNFGAFSIVVIGAEEV